MDSGQANQNDCPKDTQKKCPIKVIQTTTRAQLSQPARVSIDTCCILFPPKNTYLFYHFPTLWEFFSAKPKGQGLVTDPGFSG